MADQHADLTTGSDEEKRRPAAGVALADESADVFPALAAIAVAVAIIAGIVAGTSFDLGIPGTGGADDVVVAGAGDDGDEEPVADEVEEPVDEEPVADEPVEEEPAGITDADLDALRGQFPDLDLSAERGVLTLTGEVADEDARAAAIAAAEDVPGVTEVVDELTIAAVGEGSAVDIAASQGGIVLAGTVPDQAVADELFTRASEIYSADQIDDQLVVDPEAGTPVTVTVTGAIADEVLRGRLAEAFNGIVGVEPVDVSGLEAVEATELESSLNSLEPIQFASGSAQILPESQPVVQEAADLLLANPDVQLEVGGHTDSVGDPGPNLTLSQSRADAVVAALVELGVGADQLVPRGFGETRLKVDPDDTAEKQQENRRIEFFILG